MTASATNTISAGVRAQALASAGLLVALLIVLGWQAGRYVRARADLSLRVARAGALVRDASRIRELTESPAAKTTVTASNTGDLSAQVQAAMQAAHLDPACLLSILPQPPRHVSGSAEAERTWQLVLDDVPLNSLLSMVRRVAGIGTPLKVSALHIRPHSNGTGWGADVSLSARIPG